MQSLKMGVLGLCALLASSAAFAGDHKKQHASAEDKAKVQVVMNMVDAWNTQDWDRVVDLFTEDGVLHSMMVEPIVGHEALSARIGHIGEGIEEITLHLKHIGVVGDVVFVERVDEFVYKGHAGSVPVVGVIEVEGDRVQEWREYYDRAELLEAMGVTTDFDAEAR